jgi:hypothetical protein
VIDSWPRCCCITGSGIPAPSLTFPAPVGGENRSWPKHIAPLRRQQRQPEHLADGEISVDIPLPPEVGWDCASNLSRSKGCLPSAVAQHAAREPGQGRYLFPDSKLLRFFLDFVDGALVLAVDDVARFIDRRIHLVGILRQQILHFVEQSHQIHPSSVPRTLSSGADFHHKRPQLPMNLLPCMDRHPSDGTAAQCVYRFRVRGPSV